MLHLLHLRSSSARAAFVALGLALPATVTGVLAQAPQPAAPAAAAAPQAPIAPGTVVARIDGIDITEREVQIAREDLGDRMRQVPPAQQREYLIGFVADLKLGARAAERAKLADGPDFAARLAFYRAKVLMDEYMMRESAKAATPEAARKLFDDTVKTLTPEEEVRARHILVEKEEDAKAALERIRKGEDFAKLAGELSRDPGSKVEGGDLGYFTKERMVPQFSEAAFKLKAGEVSEPVQSQFGWHVIKVEDRRARPLPAFEEVKDEIDTFLRRRAQQEVVMGLRKDLKLERLDQPRN